ncbi:hypothetical protein BDN72DRAFT_429922 [Pluteus cervinus]|uniref:Uncharacterized protein n=1 Tax=Pluteus cervinus TaxID=181527 RepID=A0ACD3A877_9AGAR|nr:hypothetical protein BDN72DRAFT_429922 [Pluteus cervinus]
MTPSTSNICSLIHGLSIEASYRKLDTEIAQLEARLSSLKTLRNSLQVAPIAKIPKEILSEVFQYCSRDSDSSFFDDLDDNVVNTRFFVSWVCQKWRSAALATPSLWTVISKKSREVTVHLDFVQELLLRSSGFNLAINLFKPSPDVLDACLHEIQRTQHLRFIPGPLNYHQNGAIIFFSQPTPLLVSFDIRDFYDRKHSPFLGYHPYLRHLTISQMSTTISSHLIVPTLTKLHIIEPFHKIRVNYLLNQLVLLPKLTELVLVKGFSDEVVVVPEHRLEHLPLQVLSLTDTLTDVVFGFLACLDIPHAVITVIWPMGGQPFDSTTVEGISAAFNQYRIAVPFQIHHISLLEKPYRPEFSLDISDTPLRHRYSFQFPMPARSSFDFYDEICSRLSFKHLKSLSTDRRSSDLLDSAKALERLRTVEVYEGDALAEFARRLSDESQTVESQPFPALEELVVHDLTQEYDDGGLEELEIGLSIRRRAGCGLSKLVFAKCQTVDLDRFRGLVDILEVVD